MINPMDFHGAAAILPKTAALVSTTLKLRADADRLGIPVVYVNDNYGQWHSERSKIIEACAAPDRPGREMVRRIAPRPGDYFVIKPQVSGFYATNLPVLLPKLGVRRLVLAGIAADICVLFTAADAHMRDYDLWIPSDAVVGEDDRRTDWALEIMRQSLAAETRPTRQLGLEQWIAPNRRREEPQPRQER
jgi:nicotinamidase-related amidase